MIEPTALSVKTRRPSAIGRFPEAPPLLAGSTVEMTPWESCALQTEALRANLRRHNRASQGLTADMKRNHDFSSSDSELEETIEVEKESADENG